MKRNIRFLFTTLLVAMIGLGLSSCSKDDDEGGGSGGSSKPTVIVDGKSNKLNYAYYDIYENGQGLYLEFYNVDKYNMSISDTKLQGLLIDIEKYHQSDIQSGAYSADLFYYDTDIDYSSHNVHNNILLKGKVNVTITKDGDTYSVSVPETTVNIVDNDERTVLGSKPVSFSYTGKLTQSPDDE